MIIRTIQVLKLANCFDRIIVSTESQEVARCARSEKNVEISWREPLLAQDSANTVDVVGTELKRLQIPDPTNVCCVYAPNPFLHPSALKIGLTALSMDPTPDYVSSVTTFPFPVQRSLELESQSGLLRMAQPEYILTHSQNLPERYHETAQFWWATSSTWKQRKPMQINVRGIYIPRWMTQDIDTIEDWKQAEIRWRILKSNKDFENYEISPENIIMPNRL